MSLRFEQAIPAHARIVAQHMRARDINELYAGWGEPEIEIAKAIGASPLYARTAFWDLEPLAIFGMRALTVLGGSAEVWCFGTRSIERHKLAFLRASRSAVRQMHRWNPMLTNYVDVTDHEAIRWLTWLGARAALPPEERGGTLFAQFFLPRPGTKEPTCQLG